MAYHRRTRGTGVLTGLEIEDRPFDDISDGSEAVAKGTRRRVVAAGKTVISDE